jgi:hypothetical protein
LRPRFARQETTQHLGEFHGIGVAQVDHARLSAAQCRHIELFDQGTYLVHATGIVGAHQQAVGAQIRHDVEAVTDATDGARRLPGLSRQARARQRQARDQVGQIQRRGVPERNDSDIVAHRLVDLVHDAHHPADVVGVIGDDQRVGLVVGGELTGRRHERTQQRNHLGGRGVLHNQHMGHHAFAAVRLALQVHIGIGFGIGCGDDLGDTDTFDGREALRLEGGQKDLIGRAGRDRARGNDGDLSLDARIEQKIAPGHLSHCLYHTLDFSRLEVQQHFTGFERGCLGGRRFVGRSGCRSGYRGSGYCRARRCWCRRDLLRLQRRVRPFRGRGYRDEVLRRKPWRGHQQRAGQSENLYTLHKAVRGHGFDYSMLYCRDSVRPPRVISIATLLI